MELSLDVNNNPILRLYRLFQEPEVVPLDEPSSLGFRNLRLKDFTSAKAQELVKYLLDIPAVARRLCRLMFDGERVIDFAENPFPNWLVWDSVKDLIEQQKLCLNCQGVFLDLKDELDLYLTGELDSKEEMKAAFFSVLDAAAECQNCSARFTLQATLDKDILIKEYLFDDFPALHKGISAIVWYDPESMQGSFGSFYQFLLFIAQKTEKPIALFFYKPIAPHSGDYFKILPLTDPAASPVELEAALKAQLGNFTSEVLAGYQLLRKSHESEKRSKDGRLDVPPSMFLQQKEQLASYPSHPLHTEGALRSLLVYALVAWLSETTSQQKGITLFALALKDGIQSLPLAFSFTDVRRDGTSIFATSSDWRAILGRVVRDVGQSAGNRRRRQHWEDVLQNYSIADFAAPKFFDTLESIHNEFVKKMEEPLKISQPSVKPLQVGQSSVELIDLLIFLDTNKREIKFRLNSTALGYIYKDVGEVPLGKGDEDLPLGEMNELARTHLSRILEPDESDKQALVPAYNKLRSRGLALWQKIIPDDLKRAYADLRKHLHKEGDLTVFIVSDDPSFPWELVRPFEKKGSDISSTGFDDLWWALKFCVARWLAGADAPAKEIALNRVCCVATNLTLPAAQKELNYFKSLGVELDLPQSDKELINFLGTKDYDVIHFACHGKFNSKLPGESVIQMPDGSLVQPADLFEGEIIEKVDTNKPLVFLNACHSGRTGSTLSGLEGWANQFISHLGCGAFIGCGWEVTDPIAAEFAETFYESFKGGMSMGKAVHHARGELRTKYAKNSTWLAYYLYGDPNCRFRK